MNDPGLDDPVEEAAKDVEQSPLEHEQSQEEEEEENFLDPRYHCPARCQHCDSWPNTLPQPLVVCFHSMSARRRHLRAHGQRLQHLCSGRALEAVDSLGTDRGAGR